MSRTGTVTCSYCWKLGHNRTTCEGFRKTIEKIAKEDPTDWRAVRYYAKKEQKRQRLKVKKCTYCRTAGHTRPTCLELKYAKEVAIQKCTEWRKKLVQGLKRRGIGIGTLVRYNSWGTEKLGMITKIDWEDLDHQIAYGCGSPYSLTVTSFKTDNDPHRRTFKCGLPAIEGVYLPQTNQTTQFIAPISADEVTRYIPADFVNPGDVCIENIFLEKDKNSTRTAHWQITDWCALQGFYEKSE